MAESVQSVTPGESTSKGKLMKERVCWALGVVGIIAPFILPSSNLNYFWTDIVKLPAALVGTFLMVCKLWDAVNDPVEGLIIDRTKAKGLRRYGRWILPGGLVANTLAVLCFVTLPQGGTLQAVYSLAIYFLFQVSLSLVEVPHISMMSTMTNDYNERNKLASWRETCAGVTLTIISRTFLPLTVVFGAGNLNRGYFLAAAFFAVVTAPFYLICHLGAKERYQPPEKKAGEPFLASLRCLKGNTSTWLLFGCMVSWGLGAGFGGSSGMYFWRYIAGDVNYAAINGTWGSFAGIISAILVGLIANRVNNKKKIAVIAWLISAALAATKFFIPVDPFGPGRMIFNVVTLLQSIAGQLGRVFIWAMTPDCVEYTVAKYKMQSGALVVAVIQLGFKMSLSFGQGVFGWILGGVFHYLPGDAQPASTLLFFRTAMSFIPAIISFLGALCFAGYKIDKATLDAAVKEA